MSNVILIHLIIHNCIIQFVSSDLSTVKYVEPVAYGVRTGKTNKKVIFEVFQYER